MSERFTIEIELRGIDDASDELKAVSEKLKAVGTSVDEASKASGKAQERIQLLNEALKENKIAAIQSGEAVEETLRKSRASAATFKALTEQTKVFSDRAEFMAKQLNNIASVGGKLNSMFNSINMMMTRVSTAQYTLIAAQQRQQEILDQLNAKYGINAKSIEEAKQELLMMIEVIETSEEPTQAMRERLKQLYGDLKALEESEKAVAKASNELAAAQAQIPAQMAAIGLQAISLVPSLMGAINSFNTLLHMLPGVRAAFMGLYGALGPIGLALLALGAILPLIAMHWHEIEAALKPVADAIWSVVGPALDWLWNSILKPLADFLITSFKSNIETAKAIFIAVGAAVNEVAKGLQWFWDNVLVPLGTFIADVFISYIRAWIAGFMWAQEQITSIFNAIRDVIDRTIGAIIGMINSLVDTVRGAFDWLYQQLVGGSIIPEMWQDIRDWTRWGIKEMNKLMSDVGLEFNPTIRGPVSINVAVNVTSPAASAEEIAEVVSREIARRLRMI